MTSTERIANAKKRIVELERLIKYWDKSEEENAKYLKPLSGIDNKLS